MSGLGVLWAMKKRELRNRLRLFAQGARLKTLVLGTFSVAFWVALYALFLAAFDFIRRGVPVVGYQESLVTSVFHLFFLALSVMLVFSNAILGYGSLFRGRETGFLLSLPLRPETVYLYKFGETLTFSSWAFVFLGTPLMAAYAVSFDKSLLFLIQSLPVLLLFMLIPAAAGMLLSMVVTNYLPRTKRALLYGGGLAVVLVTLTVVGRLALETQGRGPDFRQTLEALESVKFSEHPLLPSAWAARIVLDLGDQRYEPALFFIGVVLANALFLSGISWGASSGLLPRGWFLTQGQRRTRRYPGRGWVDGVLDRPLFFLERSLRLIVIKDVKSFLRDPVQWSQFLIFFGLLSLYFLNLRTFSYDAKDLFWKNLIAQMNLLATSLTLSTFSSRFIFPQLSLEGRRFWVIGMAPIGREKILYGKLALSFFSSLAISETLIAVSSLMLRTPPALAMVHAVTLAGVCLGLSGLSVGLGAVYPNLTEDNPSKIVSGFGGTLNLVLALCFVTVTLLLQALPCFLYYGGMRIGGETFRLWLTAAMGGILALSLVACLVPMSMGRRALNRMEL